MFAICSVILWMLYNENSHNAIYMTGSNMLFDNDEYRI